jgi:hypothetical protein
MDVFIRPNILYYVLFIYGISYVVKQLRHICGVSYAVRVRHGCFHPSINGISYLVDKLRHICEVSYVVYIL